MPINELEKIRLIFVDEEKFARRLKRSPILMVQSRKEMVFFPHNWGTGPGEEIDMWSFILF